MPSEKNDAKAGSELKGRTLEGRKLNGKTTGQALPDEYIQANVNNMNNMNPQSTSATEESLREEKEREKVLKKQEQIEDEELKNLRDAGRSIGGQGSGHSAGNNMGSQKMIFWVAIIIHIIQGFVLGFPTSGSGLYVVILMYVIFAIIIAMFYKNTEHTRILFGGMIAACVVPIVLGISAISTPLQNSVPLLGLKGLLLLIPIVPILAGTLFSETHSINVTMKIYICFWIIIGIFTLLTTYSFGGPTKELINNPWTSVQFVGKGVSSVIGTTEKNIGNAFNQAVAQATGQPYDGNQESQVGIYVDNVKPLESQYTNISRVFVEARVYAKSVKEPISVNVICYIEGVKQGIVNPPVLNDMQDNDENTIDCDLGQLKEGTYEAKVRADFDFETSSDIEYTFVSQAVKSDQYTQLGIDEQTVATYTGGPVALGLPSLHQPLRVDAGQGNNQISSYPFGVSLENKWMQGKVVKGLKYTLNVPDEVTLIDCSRDVATYTHELQQDGVTYRNIYLFSINTTNAQDVFDAVTCRMKFNDVKTLLGNDFKSVKTFTARATYEYEVEGSTTITVAKNQ